MFPKRLEPPTVLQSKREIHTLSKCNDFVPSNVVSTVSPSASGSDLGASSSQRMIRASLSSSTVASAPLAVANTCSIREAVPINLITDIVDKPRVR